MKALSGWTYTDELGFNVTDDNRDAWKNFSRAHSHFKPFATCGWAQFQLVGDIMPSRARGLFVFSAGSTQSLDPASLDPVLPLQSQSQDNDDELSQPQTGPNQTLASPRLPTSPTPCLPPPHPIHSSSCAEAVPHPFRFDAEALPLPFRRVTLEQQAQRTTGPESIMALGRSVAGIGKVIETVFAPPKSSAMSPTKKVEVARRMALEDMNTGFLMSDERTRLLILFRRDKTCSGSSFELGPSPPVKGVRAGEVDSTKNRQ
ncbi:hypothetical protein B0H13DRAFT_2328375 [Mycena leptocephala]|nr:hypothetical protein B0H13DRAFT_2328375 [Mycena leptocephala]